MAVFYQNKTNLFVTVIEQYAALLAKPTLAVEPRHRIGIRVDGRR